MRVLLQLMFAASLAFAAFAQDRTVVGIRGSVFTINGHPTYTADLRAVQAIFDDANYPKQGSRQNPYSSNTMGAVSFDYPDGKWDPERNTNEFVAALPDWRRAGLLAFTVNLPGGGPTDGNYGENVPMQPHHNSGFDAQGNLKPAYAQRDCRLLLSRLG